MGRKPRIARNLVSLKPKQASVVVVGSSNTDMVIRSERLPRPGETVLGGEFFVAAGGKGANQAVAAARAGARVAFIAAVGRDMFGDQALRAFRAEGLDVSAVQRIPKHPSGVALIFIDREGENLIGVAGGANRGLTPSHVRMAEGKFAGARVLLVQLETPLPTVRAALRLARKNGLITVLNPAPAAELPAVMLKDVDIITPNETETAMLLGRLRAPADPEKAARLLCERGPRDVVMTLGARGAFVYSNGHGEMVPAPKVKAIDAVGAGDALNGALAVALAEARDLVSATRFAVHAAALSVTRLGAQPSLPKRREIERFVRTGRLAIRRQAK